MKKFFKKKLSIEECVDSLMSLTRSIPVDLVNDKAALEPLGLADVEPLRLQLYYFQYIMYRTNLILWSKSKDELLYADISRQYYDRCEDYINSFTYNNKLDQGANYYSRKKLFAEFHKLLNDNYSERLKGMICQMRLIYHHLKGSEPSCVERSYLLSVAIEIEDRIIYLVNSLKLNF